MESMEIVQDPILNTDDDDGDDDAMAVAGTGGEEGLGGDWSDWEQRDGNDDVADDASDPAFCLFCPQQFPAADDVLVHCSEDHGFDFMAARKDLRLDFYSCIKAVNYIRHQVLAKRCPVCLTSFSSVSALNIHMCDSRHFGLPTDTSTFAHDKFLKGVLEADPLLYAVEWSDDGDAGSAEVATVVAGEHETPAEKMAAKGVREEISSSASLVNAGSGSGSGVDEQVELVMDSSINSVEELAWKGAGAQDAELASEVLVLRRQNAELAIQLAQIQAELAASALSGVPVGTFSRLSTPSTPSRSPPVPLTPASTPVHSSSPRHSNPVSLGAAFGAPGVAAGLSLGIRLRQREATASGSAADLASFRAQESSLPPLHPTMGPLHIPRVPTPSFATPDRVPATPYQTPAVSPSPSSGYLSAAFSAAAAAAALETVAALGPGFSLGSETPSPAPSAAGTPRKNPRTPVSTPVAMSPVPSYSQFGMTAADAHAAAALLSAWAERRSSKLGRVVEAEKEQEEDEEEGEEDDMPDAEEHPAEDEGVVAAVSAMETGAPGQLGVAESGGGVAPARALVPAAGRRARLHEAVRRVDANYFGSYGGLRIHREMLADKVRTQAYQKVLAGNPGLVSGAVVMDVGCGTGILSLFAARAGARRVLGIDASSDIIAVATQVARDNGYLKQEGSGTRLDFDAVEGPEGACSTEGTASSRQVVTYVNCRVEELQELTGGAKIGSGGGTVELGRGEVDVLVSEWMGYGLLCESMLQSVLHARDSWLKPGGAILPDIANMYVAGFGEGATSLPFWKDVYGFSMASVGKMVQEDVAREALVCQVAASDVVTESCLVQTIDLCTVTNEATHFTVNFELKPLDRDALSPAPSNMDSNGASAPVQAPRAGTSFQDCIGCYGLALWFDTIFSERFCKTTPAVLSTSPFSPPTHWAQTLFTLRRPVFLAKPAGGTSPAPSQGSDSLWSAGKERDIGTEEHPATSIKCRLSVSPGVNHRDVDFSVEMTAIGASGQQTRFPAQMFSL